MRRSSTPCRSVLGRLVVAAAAMVGAAMAPCPAHAAESPPAVQASSSSMRLRIGFSFAAGPVVAPGLFAGGGFAFRMGIQKSALLAAYVQVMPMGFAKVGRAGGESRRGIVALVPTSFMGALTPWDWLEVAAGPSIDYAGAQVAFYPRGTKESAHAVLFGVAGRVAFHIGSRDPETGDRASLTFGLNPHVTFLEDGSPFVLVTAGFGADWY